MRRRTDAARSDGACQAASHGRTFACRSCRRGGFDLKRIAVGAVLFLLAAAGAYARDTQEPSDDALKNAIPLNQLGKLPSTAEQYRALKNEIEKTRPGVEAARQKSQALSAETASLKQRLIATASAVQKLEEDKGRLDEEITSLSSELRVGTAQFAHDRIVVGRLLAVLERLQQDMPPAMVMQPADALSASRGAMVLGATLPRLYTAATALSDRLRALNRTRLALTERRTDSARNWAALTAARSELDQLLAMKSQEADEASARYGDLAAQLDTAANEAASLSALLSKVASLRDTRPSRGIVVVTAQNENRDIRRGPLLRPVAGRIERGDWGTPGGEHAPGLSFIAPAGAHVVAPADCQVLFAGRYHKSGQVLILESVAGYDLVLEGLERADVKSGDALLAGEPLGTMPATGAGSRLYFELRQNGKGVNPAPWLEVDLRKARKS